jgi:hypothetical protein
MKKKQFIILTVLMFGLVHLGYGGEKKAEISGRLKLFTSLFASENIDGPFFQHESGEFGFRRLEARVKLGGYLNERITYAVRFDAFAHSGSILSADQFPESNLLGMPLLSEHFELNLYEGYIKVSKFLAKNLDLTVGKQRIQWGSADKLNVVDNLNPLDFANFFTFDPDYAFERRPQTAVNLEYYLGTGSKLQLVWLLGHQVSPMPFGYTFLTKGYYQLTEIDIQKDWQDRLKDSNFAVRFSTNLLNMDLGLSYYLGNSALPVLLDLTVGAEPRGTFIYPRLQVWGLDLAGELFGVGFWAEAAWNKIADTTASLTGPFTQAFPLFEDGFIKYVVGLDYNFGRGFYGNIQFLHGFFDEFDYSEEAESIFQLGRGRFFGGLENYLVAKLEYKTARDNLKLSLSGIYEMGAEQALVLTPGLEARVADGMLIQAGGFLVVSGDEEKTKFGILKDDKLLYLGFRIDF